MSNYQSIAIVFASIFCQMDALLIFLQHKGGLHPIELESSATVGDIWTQIKRNAHLLKALEQPRFVLTQGDVLMDDDSALLADLGICHESTLCAVEQQSLSCGCRRKNDHPDHQCIEICKTIGCDGKCGGQDQPLPAVRSKDFKPRDYRRMGCTRITSRPLALPPPHPFNLDALRQEFTSTELQKIIDHASTGITGNLFFTVKKRTRTGNINVFVVMRDVRLRKWTYVPAAVHVDPDTGKEMKTLPEVWKKPDHQAFLQSATQPQPLNLFDE